MPSRLDQVKALRPTALDLPTLARVCSVYFGPENVEVSQDRVYIKIPCGPDVAHFTGAKGAYCITNSFILVPPSDARLTLERADRSTEHPITSLDELLDILAVLWPQCCQ